MITAEAIEGRPYGQPTTSVNLGGFEVTGQTIIEPEGLHNIILPPGTTVELPSDSPLAALDLSDGRIDDSTLLSMLGNAVRVTACGVVNIDASGTLAATEDGMNLVLKQFSGAHGGMQLSQTGTSLSELTINGQPTYKFPVIIPAGVQIIR
jgi:hypothetical protein